MLRSIHSVRRPLFVIASVIALGAAAPTVAAAVLRNCGYIQLTRVAFAGSPETLPSGSAWFARALAVRPSGYESLLGRARAAVLERDAQVLEQHWRATSPGHWNRLVISRFLMRRAVAARDADRRSEAHWTFSQLIRLEPDDATGYLGMGDLALSAGDFGRAMDFYVQAGSRVPSARNAALLGRARALRAMGQHQESVRLFEQILTQQPTQEEKVTAYFELGVTHEAVGQPDKALTAFSAVIDSDPNGSIGWLAGMAACRRGDIAARRNQLERAAADYELGARLHQRMYPQYSVVERGVARRLKEALRKP